MRPEIVPDMLGDIADQVHKGVVALNELPGALDPGEAIVVTTGQDDLERQ